ncbi:nuclear transport factor 2 family protein [Actinosynnema pretiosum subsp. pretiosum]|uniref:SnoaL-like domain-containing protein n=2 Tax=Actinosynnema TaxID=40566 RepID=C6WFX8_ACTMD|nr:nuclear transport factor 2 family protein [Actinosynnema mirum]ACU37914.1 hypothetical protein Amir_4053 [Actinosynnema mirum DSM 43827]AXX31404.1 hypothetical protein APASM_4039 [Actinosynnema pretiosum subsp. pretiosum]QUF04545.1 nuclear transport factor 2 family protein [Actinosynnema pretiosum subsp. pretiosum]
MSDNNGVALQTALAHFQAVQGRDMDAAAALTSEEVVLKAPTGESTGKAGLQGFWSRFLTHTTELRLLEAYGDDEGALLLQEATTTPDVVMTFAEHLTVTDGKITAATYVFDPRAFIAARAAEAQAAAKG